jgi:fucose 4-O-acetylase-like acetyltransferase
VVHRLNWIDYAKGLIIFGVVYGHSLNSAANAGLAVSPTFRSLSDATLSNMLPLFFFLAGVFVPRGYEKRSTRSFLLERLQRLAYPYLIWSALQATAAILFAAHSHDDTTFETLLAIPYEPFDQFWFLYALLWMYPIYALTRRLGGRWSSLMFAAVSIALFVFPIRTELLALEMLSLHLLFFAAGALFSPFMIGERALPDLPVWATVLVTVAFVGSSLYIYTHWLDASTGTASHGKYRIYYLYLGLLAGLATVGWAQWLSRRGLLGVFQVIGKYSLQVFVAHMFCVVGFRIVAQRVFRIADPYLIVIGCIAAGVAGPIVLAWVTERFGLPNLFELRPRQTRRPAVEPAPRPIGHDR